MKKQIFSCLFLIFIIVSFGIQAQFVAKHGELQVKGVKLLDKNGAPIVLRGMSFGWHNWYPQFYNAETVNWLKKDWNCTIVRAAMGIEPEGAFKSKPEWSEETICKVVDAAIKEDIYVIIDWHSHNINLEEAKAFFGKMATKYGSNPHVIYEIFNEPDYETWKEVKAYSIEIIKTIRAIDPDNLILVGCPHWDQDIDDVAKSPIGGFSNLMYTVHFYAATHKQSLRDKSNVALSKGIPIFISESAGMEASGDGKLDETSWQNWIDWVEKNQISWITWSVSSKNETCSVLNEKASEKGNWNNEQLKESGIKTKALLLKYNRE